MSTRGGYHLLGRPPTLESSFSSVSTILRPKSLSVFFEINNMFYRPSQRSKLKNIRTFEFSSTFLMFFEWNMRNVCDFLLKQLFVDFRADVFGISRNTSFSTKFAESFEKLWQIWGTWFIWHYPPVGVDSRVASGSDPRSSSAASETLGSCSLRTRASKCFERPSMRKTASWRCARRSPEFYVWIENNFEYCSNNIFGDISAIYGRCLSSMTHL